MKQRITQYRNTLATLLNQPAAGLSDITVISNDCWGGALYQEFHWEYRSPFVGLAIMAPDYLHLLSDLKGFLNSPLRFKNSSRYPEVNTRREDPTERYPIGVLGSLHDDLEIHFIHYHSEEEATSKWNRRIERMNWNRLVYKFAADKDHSTPQLLRQFDQLPFPIKIAFSKNPHPELKQVVHVPNYVTNGAMLYRRSIRQFDLPTWLATGRIRRTSHRTQINKLLYSFGV
jgi:uncharacterized protein (DUF1919 family)